MRLTIRFHLLALLVLALTGTGPPALAQLRSLPERSKLGTLEIQVFPRAILDGKEVLLAPGTRIVDESNLTLIPSNVRGARPVLYRTDLMGQVSEIWLLTPAELARAQERASNAGSATR